MTKNTFWLKIRHKGLLLDIEARCQWDPCVDRWIWLGEGDTGYFLGRYNLGELLQKDAELSKLIERAVDALEFKDGI